MSSLGMSKCDRPFSSIKFNQRPAGAPEGGSAGRLRNSVAGASWLCTAVLLVHAGASWLHTGPAIA